MKFRGKLWCRSACRGHLALPCGSHFTHNQLSLSPVLSIWSGIWSYSFLYLYRDSTRCLRPDEGHRVQGQLKQESTPGSCTEGSKYPIFQISGPEHHRGYGFWHQKPEILSTWTLRVPELLRSPRPFVDQKILILMASFKGSFLRILSVSGLQ